MQVQTPGGVALLVCVFVQQVCVVDDAGVGHAGPWSQPTPGELALSVEPVCELMHALVATHLPELAV